MKKKEEENIFVLPGFPSVSKQFTANGFVDVASESVQETEPTGAQPSPLEQPKTKPSKKGKKDAK